MARSRLGENQFKDADVLSPYEHDNETNHYFDTLADVTTYSGHAGEFLVVKEDEAGLEYTTAPTGSGVSSFILNNYITGFNLSNAADALHDVSISVGFCADSTNTENIELTSEITKQIDESWVVGSDSGGLDTGAVAADTIYSVWIIKRSDTGNVDALFSASMTSPTMPANYDHKRFIGYEITDSSSNIVPSDTITRGDFITKWFKARHTLVTGLTATSYTTQSTSSVIPTTLSNVEAHFGGTITNGDVQDFYLSSDGVNLKMYFGLNASLNSVGQKNELYYNATAAQVGFMPIINNQIYYKTDAGYSTTIFILAVRFVR